MFSALGPPLRGGRLAANVIGSRPRCGACGADGTCDSRASSHHSYNYDGGIGSWLSDAGIFPRSAWGALVSRTSRWPRITSQAAGVSLRSENVSFRCTVRHF